MKLIKSIDETSVFINLNCSKKFRSGVTIDMEVQVTGYKHTYKNEPHGEPDGKWKIDCVEIADYTVKVGKRLIEGGAVKIFLEGNKAVGVDYVQKTFNAIEAEVYTLGIDELTIQAGIKLVDTPEVIKPWFVYGGLELVDMFNELKDMGLKFPYAGDINDAGYYKDANGQWQYGDIKRIEAEGYTNITLNHMYTILLQDYLDKRGPHNSSVVG